MVRSNSRAEKLSHEEYRWTDRLTEDPILTYVPAINFGVSGEATVLTISSSRVTTTAFAPCSYLVNAWALKAKTQKHSQSVQSFLYLARPIDAIIQAIVMPMITAIDHFRDCIRGRPMEKLFKVLCTPLSLSFKLFCALFFSAGYLIEGAFQLTVPYSMVAGIVQGKKAAQAFFYARAELYAQTSHIRYLNPLKLLPLNYNDDQNPFILERNALFNSIEPEFRDFNNPRNLGQYGWSEKCSHLAKLGEMSARIIREFGDHCVANLDDTSEEFQKKKKELLAAKQQLKQSKVHFEKRNLAKRKFWNINQIAGLQKAGSLVYLNTGVPAIAYIIIPLENVN